MGTVIFIVFGIVLVPLVALSIPLLRGKGAFLIAGYNTLSKAEQSKYDEKSMCRSVGRFLLATSLCTTLIPFGIYFAVPWLAYLGVAVTILIVVGYLIYFNTGKRFQKNCGFGETSFEEPVADEPTISSPIITQNNDNKTKTIQTIATKVAMVGWIVILVLAVVGTGAVFFYGEREPEIQVYSDCITIDGMYGLQVDFADIADISLLEQSMNIIGTGSKENGYGGFDGTFKGQFHSDELGDILLFVKADSPVTIQIVRDNGKAIYISFSDTDKTRALYVEMIEAFSG